MKNKIIVFTIILCMAFAFSSVALAGDLSGAQNTLGNFGKESYGEETPTELPLLIGQIISVVLSVLGIVLVIIIIRGGFVYMLAGGEPKKTDDGKAWMVNGIIGLVICILAWAISSFVVGRLMEATTVVN